MKSLKRTLCLVLALVMVLGLFGIASATNFTDDNTIQYKEAVEVITGIGAIKGYDNGTFNPKGTITRAEAAVMVARVALTNAIADDLKGVSSNFTDVTVEGGFSWAIPSIEYLVSKNIINGMGDGTFNPNGQISGYAVLKMLLCVLGYGAKQEYTGTGWDLQVAVDANNKGLTAGRADGTPALSASATREEVALYCYNALGNEIVSYNGLENRYEKDNTNSTYVTNPQKKTTLADDVYGLKVAEGVVTSNGAISSADAKAGKTTIKTVAATPEVYSFKIDTGLDLIGHYVKVYYRNAAPVADGNTVLVNGSSVVDLTDSVVKVTTAVADAAGWVKTFGSTDVKKAAKVFGFEANTYDNKDAVGAGIADGTTAGANVSYIIYKNQIVAGIEDPTVITSVVTDVKAPTASAAGHIKLQGVTADIPTASAVVTASSRVGTISIPSTSEANPATLATYARASIYDGIAKGDVAFVQQTGDKVSVTKANMVTGTVSAYAAASGSPGDPTYVPATVTVNGTAYPVHPSFYSNSTDLTAVADIVKLESAAGAALINSECNLYLAPTGAVVAVGKVTGATPDLVYVVCTYNVSADTGYGVANTLMAQCVDMDGNEVKYPVSAESTDYKGAPDADIGELATVTLAYDTTAKTNVAKFKKVAAGVAGTDKTICPVGQDTAVTSGSPVITDTTHYFGTDTVVLFVNGSKNTLKVTALTGAQALKGGAETYTYYATQVGESTSTNYAVKYVVVKGTPTGSAANGLMFVPAVFNDNKQITYTNANGVADKASVHTAYVDGTPNTDVRTTVGTDTAIGFYTYTTNAQGIYTLNPVTSGVGIAKVTNQYGSLISIQPINGAEIANLNGASAYVKDPVYDALADKTGATNHTALTDLAANNLVAYVLSSDAKSVVGLYYLAPSDAGLKTLFSANVASTAAGTEGTYTIAKIGTGGIKALPGSSVTVDVVATAAQTTATRTTVTVTLKNGATSPLGSVTFAVDAEDDDVMKLTFTVPATIDAGGLTLEAVENTAS